MNGSRAARRGRDIGVALLLMAICYGIALHQGIYRSFTAEADADITYVYNALLLNDGLPQAYFDHPGYVYFLILAAWFKLGHFLGLLDVSRLSELPGPATFEPYFAALEFAGRWLSATLAAGLSVGFFFFLKRLTGSRAIAGLCAVFLAISPGLVVQSIILHTELPAMIFVLLAFFALVAAGRSLGDGRFLFLGLAVCLATLGLMAKLQVVALVLALPVLALVFSDDRLRFPGGAIGGDGGSSRVALVIAAFAFSVPAQVMIWTQVHGGRGAGGVGFPYQMLIAGYLVGAAFVYARICCGAWSRGWVVLAAVSAGLALGLYANFLHNSALNVQALANFIEHMMRFSVAADSAAAGDVARHHWLGTLAAKFAKMIGETLARNYLAVSWGGNLFRLLYWLVTGGIVAALIRRRWRLALQAGVLLGLSLAMDAFSGLRYWAEHYRIFAEPWLLIAGALLLAGVDWRERMADWRRRMGSRYFGMAGVAAVVLLLVIMSGIMTGALAKRPFQAPDRACIEATGYLPRLVDYFCRGS